MVTEVLEVGRYISNWDELVRKAFWRKYYLSHV